MRIGLVTSRSLPEPDVDEELLLAALGGRGADARMIAWDDPRCDPGAFERCIIRSTWDYHLCPDEFLVWVDAAAAATDLHNRAGVVRWNLHKSYLRFFESRGVAIVPTAWAACGDEPSLGSILDERGWDEVVIKPAISAGSFMTRRFSQRESAEGEAFLCEVTKLRDAMVQRYMPSVENGGERSLVWIDGELTHAICKQPRYADGVERVSAALAIEPAERRFAERVMGLLPFELLYARVDTMRDERGEVCLSELELIEPSLFLMQSSRAMERLVGAILRE
jgi:hypothetical protein